MEIRQISISTPSIRIGLLERITGFIKGLPLNELKVGLKTLVMALYKTIKTLIGQVIKLFVFLKNIILKMTTSIISSIKEKRQNTPTSRRINLPSKKIAKVLLLIGIAAVVLISGAKIIGRLGKGGISDTRQEVQGAKASQDLNREFTFPLKNSEGEEVSRIHYGIEKAELRDEIIVKGQKATAIKGRTFLILTLKIKNDYDQPIEIDTRDYVRLSIDNDGEWLAPTIHNDPVEVQAISTMHTRLGFPIDDESKNLVLQIGEISGEKERVSIEFK